MADYSSDDIRYLLRPGSPTNTGTGGAADITRAHLEAEAKRLPRLRWVFALGAVSSLGLLWLCVELLTGAIPTRLQIALVGAPWLVCYYFLGGDLAFFKLPIPDWVKAIATLLAFGAFAVIYFLFFDWATIAAGVLGLFIGLGALAAYTAAFLDKAFIKMAEHVRFVLTQVPKSDRGRDLRDQFSTLLYAATIGDVVRHADSPSEAIRETIGKMPYLNAAGQTQARRYFETEANKR